jgi:hypothetical protein
LTTDSSRFFKWCIQRIPVLLIMLCSLFILNPVVSSGQDKFTVSGFVKSKSTGEFLIGANVYFKEKMKGTTTNTYGFYSITIEKGSYTLVSSFIGYRDHQQEITIDRSQRVNIDLEDRAIQVEEVVITGEKSDKNVRSTQMGTVELEIEKIKTLPAFLGEVDILKTIQLLPGVQSAGEGNSGYYIRGGGPDQNLILLDEAVVYNASHLFGFFSVFNSESVKNVNLIKGGMPAMYGGRLASVLDITMKEGNSKEFHAEGGIGVIASRLTVEGPLKKDVSSFMLSGRRTYIDVLTRPFISKSSNAFGSGYYFYDLNTKLNYRLSDRDRLFASGYFGRDVFSYRNRESGFKVDIPWGNATASLRWNHLFNDRLFMNTSLIFSDYKFEFGAEQTEFEFRLFSGIRDFNAKVDFNYFPDIRHNVRFGVNVTQHRFTPSNASARSGEVVFDFGKIERLHGLSQAVYISDDFELNDKWAFHTGLRLSGFTQIGPFDRFVKDFQGRTTDTIHYKTLENVQSYYGLEPRISGRYALNRKSSIKGSFTQNYQYIHMVSVSAVSLPTDLWIPSSSLVKPQDGRQYALGYFRNFSKDVFETSAEIYYKDMRNVVEYKDGAQPEDNVNDNVDNNLTFGKGDSYGLELFLKKRTGKWNGWLGYTLSKTTRKFTDLNDGDEFFAKYDRRHDGSAVANYDYSKKWTFSAVFVYGTGNALTLPVSRYLISGYVVNDYGKRNWYRMVPYHRMDISATLYVKKSRKLESSWNFSVYNLYNRKNPYFIYFANTGNVQQGTLKISAKQVSLFPILPSVTWNFKF